MFAWLRRFLFPPRSRNTIYGFEAVECRSELLEVKKRHRFLLEKRRHSSDKAAVDKEIDANIARIDDIEKRYFGQETAE